MREITTTLRIDKAGRVLIPQHIREEFKLDPGALVEIIIHAPKENQ